MSKQIVSVVTGDVVNSQKIAPENYQKMLAILESTLVELTKQTDARFDMYRGDAFQIVFFEPADAVLSALKIRLTLKTSELQIDARQCIGVGEAMYLGKDTKTSTGEAFVLSGTGLDKLKSNYLSVQSSSLVFQDKIELLTRFVDAHLRGLTKKQTEALLSYLVSQNKSHKDVADALGKERRNTTKLLNASHYQLVEEYVRHFEKCVNEEYQ
jgi:tRNA(Met) C34 N-acetyltransferase TmcA